MAEVIVPGLPESDGIVFKTAPAGIYDARIAAVELTKTKADSKWPGNPMIMITAKVQHEDFPNVQVRSWFMIPSDQMEAEDARMSTAKIKRLWEACGLDSSSANIDTDDLLHTNLRIQLGVEKYQGEDRNKLVDVLPAG